jgi:hypothetical protein
LFGFIPSAGTFIPEAAFNPAAGYRARDTGGLGYVGSNGYYWSSSPSSSSNGYYLYFSSTSVTSSNNTNRAYGFSARCIAAFITVFFYMAGIIDLRNEKRMGYFILVVL